MEIFSEEIDYGKLAYLKVEELLRRIVYLEGEVKRLSEEA